jgi:deferrochelatase/peroxidase EfeB
MLGFMDGIANPDTGNRAEMDRLVWIQPGTVGEPAWTATSTTCPTSTPR